MDSKNNHRLRPQLGHSEQALDTYHWLVTGYRFNPRADLREFSVSALRESSVLLTDLGHTQEAIKAYDEVDRLPLGHK